MATEEKLKPYSDEEVEAKIVEDGLDGWYLDGGWLRRKYSTDGWPSTLMLVNTVGYICEAACHHADLAVTWGKLWVKLTHALERRHHRQGLRRRAPDRGRRAVAPGRRQPAGGHAEQVRLQQGHALETQGVSERLLFVTGKLAAPALRDTLGRADLPFDYDVAVMKITVAALMTTDWIAKLPRRARGGHADHDPGDVRGRGRRPERALRGPGRQGPRGPQGDPELVRAGRRARGLRRARHPRVRRDQPRPAPGSRPDLRGGRVLPRRRRGRDRPRALARPQLARARGRP